MSYNKINLIRNIEVQSVSFSYERKTLTNKHKTAVQISLSKPKKLLSVAESKEYYKFKIIKSICNTIFYQLK